MKNNTFILLLCLITIFAVFTTNTQAQNTSLNWATTFGGTGAGNGQSTVADASGNVYTVSYFQGTVDFDPTAGVNNVTSAGDSDIAITKQDANGNLLWVKRIGGATADVGRIIVLDAANNVYTTGYFSGTVDFDPGIGTTNLTAVGGNDVFISKLDQNGNFLLVKSMGGTGIDFSESITLDILGNIYTTGYFQGTADFDPNAGTSNLVAVGLNDVFISKLDATGNFVWAKAMGSANNEEGVSIDVDRFGNVYTTGYFSGTVDFDPNAGTVNLTSSGGGSDFFVTKLDVNGNLQWAKNIGGTGTDYAFTVGLDAAEANIYLTGYFTGVVDFDPNAGINNVTSFGGTDAFVAKLDVAGNLVWAKGLGGAGADNSVGLALDAADNVYTIGTFNGTADFDPNAATFNLVSAGGADIFMSKLNSSGAFVWAQGVGGLTGDFGISIAVSTAGNVYTTGILSGTADFDPSNCTSNLSPIGASDIFVAKYTQCTVTINPATLANAIINAPYSQALIQTGLSGTLAWSVCTGTLPTGLLLGTTSGIISGTATALGTFSVNIRVGDGTCSQVKTYSLVVACPTITFTNTTATSATVGTPYTLSAGATGNTSALTYTVSPALPAGLGINSTSGAITGTPTTVSFVNIYTVTASQTGVCSNTQDYNFAVNCPTITFTNTTATSATIGTPYTLNAGATGNTTALTYTVTPALPAGLSINNATGVISGTPTTVTASATYTVSISQGGPCSYTQNYTFLVNSCVPFRVLPATNFLPPGNVNVPYVGVTFAAENAVSGVVYRFEKRNIIPWQLGITLNPTTGVVSGTPTFSTSINVAIVAVNTLTNCESTVGTYTLVIYPDPATSVDNGISSQVKVSPNPSNADFNVDFGNLNVEKGVVRVYDAQGKQVFSADLSNNSNLMTISLSNFSNGIYLMEIQTSKGRILKKLAKQ